MITASAPETSEPGGSGPATPRMNEDAYQKSDKLLSTSSELSDLSSEGVTPSTSRPTPSDDADTAFQSMDEDGSQTSSSDGSDSNENTPKKFVKLHSREERVRCRDLLNKKLEQMFVKANIELTPYGRIPWTRLGEVLSARGLYISGFPEELAPRVTNDQLTAGTAPSTWSLNRTKPLLALLDAGKIKLLPRPPGRRVLFELTRPNGTTVDSTIGYSSRWLHTHMPSEFPAIKRSRSDLVAGSLNSSRSPSRCDESSDWSSGSASSDDDNVAWKPHRKRPRLSESRPSPLLKSLRRSTHQSAQSSKSGVKSKRSLHDLKQGEKWKEGGVIKKVGRGWIVVEESTEEEDSSKNGKEAGKDTRPSTSRQTSPPRPVGTSKKRKHNDSPEPPQRPAKRQHQEEPAAPSSYKAEFVAPDSVSDEMRLKIVVTRIARLIRDAGYTGVKKIPWSTLPTFLAQKNLYITGFPYNCLPKIDKDEVKKLSSPPHWTPGQCTAMLDSFNRNHVKILPRPPGRRVLFEAIGVDEKFFDSTCGYSSSWIANNLGEEIPPNPPKKPVSDKNSPKVPEKTASPRPTLKLVIPETGAHLNEPKEKIKPVLPQRIEQTKATKVDDPASKPPNPIPRPSIPTPVIFLQPPTPVGGQEKPATREKLKLEDSPSVESPTVTRPTSPNEPQSPGALSPPPLPPPVDPVARPYSQSDKERPQANGSSPPKRAMFTFVIPPNKKGKGLANNTAIAPPASDSMSIDGNGSSDNVEGYNLDLMFEASSIEDPAGRLPVHLQPKVPAKSGSTEKVLPPSSTSYLPKKLLRPGETVIGSIQPLTGVSIDSKYSIEKVVRPSLIKLFDAAGLSSPSTPIPWVMLPLMLCQRQLFISGFPRQCLPRVIRDKVDVSSGPRGWSYPAFVAMFHALRAGEVKIQRRPRGRRVLFHLLPTDEQIEEGNKHGTDSTLHFSQSWLDQHMVDNPDDVQDEEMQFEPSEKPIVVQKPLPLRREVSVWERFGKIKIEESESENEDRVPAPPWKIAMEEFLRPSIGRDEEEAMGASSTLQSGEEEEQSDEEVEYPLHLLLPSHIPHHFQGKGRIILSKDDLFEWIPYNPYATDCPPERVVWSASKRKWKSLPQMRDMDGWARRIIPQEIPNRAGGKILSKGVCEHNTTRKAWECSFIGRKVLGDLRWAPDLCSWEWILQDVDGRRKWIAPRIPDRSYDSVHEDTLSPMSM